MIPLEALRLNRRSHLSALWWLGLLYRRPKQFEETLEGFDSWQRVAVGLRLFCHQLPYTVVLCSLGRLVIFGALGTEAETSPHQLAEALLWHAQLVVSGIAVGIIFGMVVMIFGRNPVGVVGGIVVGIAFGTSIGITERIAFGFTFGITFAVAGSIVSGIAFGIALGIAVGTTVGLAVGTTVGIGVGIAVGIGSSAALLRTYYQPLHLLFLWPNVRRAWYPYHPVAWDDCCRIPFPSLYRLLVGYHELEPKAAEQEIGRLIDSYPSQRFQAQRARAILIARRAGKRRDRGDLSLLDEIVANLPEGNKGFLSQTPRLHEMIHEICSLQARINALDRPFLKEPWARLLCREIEQFRERLADFRRPLAEEFRAAASNWLAVAREQHADAAAVLAKEPTLQVFRAGDPVDPQYEAFVPRNAVFGEIEREVMLATGCPGIILYGARRTGKSTVLRNLDGFLPPQVLCVGVSMQKPSAFTSLATLVATLADALGRAVDALDPAVRAGDLRYLFRILDTANRKLSNAGQRLLFSIDEYENIDRKIGEGIFPEDLLAALRESIQTHRRITWIFAGNHNATELRHAPWTSYLVSARTIKVGLFTPAETRLLLTEPLKHSSKWSKDDPTRPRFEPGFWGEGGIERIHDQTGGWPHLVQLVAESVIDLLNDNRRTTADLELLERALDRAIDRGDPVLSVLMRRKSTLSGEWDYLAGFRTCATQPPPADEVVASSLRRRLLITEEDGLWRLRVPLMERWLHERG